MAATDGWPLPDGQPAPDSFEDDGLDDYVEPTRAQRWSRRSARAFVPLLVICALGILSWVYFDSAQHHSYDSGRSTDAIVKITRGRTYIVSVQGGVTALQEQGIAVTSQCVLDAAGGESELTVTPYTSDSRTVNAVGTFVAPVSGDVRIRCTGIESAWIDDADDSAFDFSGLGLVVALLAGLAALVIRLQLGWQASGGASAKAPATSDQIEAGIGRAGAQREVGDGHRGDVSA